MNIGLDLDNTIVTYDHVFPVAAVEMGLIAAGEATTKVEVSRLLKARGDEEGWQRLQGQVYGRFMALARPMDGVVDFLLACRARSIPVTVVSHKTVRGHFDPAGIDLRQAARQWLLDNQFFERLGLAPDRVFFEGDREAKVARIAALGFTHFVDDLPDVLGHPAFPTDVVRVLFAPQVSDGQGAWETCQDWAEVARVILGNRQ